MRSEPYRAGSACSAPRLQLRRVLPVAHLAKLGRHRDGTDPLRIIRMRPGEHPDMERFGHQHLALDDLVVLGEPSLAPLRDAGVNLYPVSVARWRPEVTARGYDGCAQDAMRREGIAPGRDSAVAKKMQRRRIEPAEKIRMKNNPAGIAIAKFHGDFQDVLQSVTPRDRRRIPRACFAADRKRTRSLVTADHPQ